MSMAIASILFLSDLSEGSPRTLWQSIIMVMIIIFWEMTPCGSYKNRRFGGSYRLHLQGDECEQVQSEIVSSCIGGDSRNTTPCEERVNSPGLEE
jgi:hypothetical protein